MTVFPKILLVVVAIRWFAVTGHPLFQGISFQRGFEINFKPLPFKPIAFLKEKWSPFGVFGKKFAIQKRSLDDIVPPPPLRVPRPAAPVFEHIEEIEEIGTAPLLILPRPMVKPPLPPVPPPPIVSPKPPPLPPQTPPKKPPPAPIIIPKPIIVDQPPPLLESSEGIPPITTNMVIIQPTKVVNSHFSTAPGLYTDISQVESIKEHIHTVKPYHPPPLAPKPPVPIAPIPPPPPIEPKPPVPIAPIPPPPVEPKPPIPIAPPPPPPVELKPHVPIAPIPPPPVEPKPPVPIEPIPPPPPIPSPPDVAKEAIKEEIKEEKQEEKKEEPSDGPKEILLKNSTFIKGSKMALKFGKVFLTLMANFFDSARVTIDTMSNAEK